MDTRLDPKELTLQILKRSQCAVQVGAVLEDSSGVFAWGWNSAGRSGFGQCAEAHAIERANPKRLAGATLYVASRRHKSGSTVTARPCEACQRRIKQVGRVIYRDQAGWHHYR